MAVFGPNMSIGIFPAVGALEPYRCVKLSAGSLTYAEDGEPVLGVTDKDGATAAGKAVNVAYLGWVRAEAGDTITQFQYLCAGTDGKVVPATAAYTDTSDASAADPLVGSDVIGVALEAGAVGEVISILLLRLGAVPALTV